jgi:hypothetical protein
MCIERKANILLFFAALIILFNYYNKSMSNKILLMDFSFHFFRKDSIILREYATNPTD